MWGFNLVIGENNIYESTKYVKNCKYLILLKVTRKFKHNHTIQLQFGNVVPLAFSLSTYTTKDTDCIFTLSVDIRLTPKTLTTAFLSHLTQLHGWLLARLWWHWSLDYWLFYKFIRNIVQEMSRPIQMLSLLDWDLSLDSLSLMNLIVLHNRHSIHLVEKLNDPLICRNWKVLHFLSSNSNYLLQMAVFHFPILLLDWLQNSFDWSETWKTNQKFGWVGLQEWSDFQNKK